MLAIEANDEWLVGRGYISQHSRRLYEPARQRPLTHKKNKERRHRLDRGLSRQRITDDMSAELLHHVPGLD